MMSEAKKLEKIDVADMARQALNQANGDAYKATAILEEHARRDVTLANELLMPLLHQACYDAVRYACIRDRGYVAKQANNVTSLQAKAGAKRLKAHATRLMGFLLPIGQKRLADATKVEIETNVTFYQQQAKTMTSRGQFLALVARQLAGKKKVKNALTEDVLLQLWQEAHA